MNTTVNYEIPATTLRDRSSDGSSSLSAETLPAISDGKVSNLQIPDHAMMHITMGFFLRETQPSLQQQCKRCSEPSQDRE